MPKKKTSRKTSLAVARQVKSYIRERGFCAAADLADAASQKLTALLDDAISRTKANGRRVVRPADL